jgi:hypothetical protein
MNIIDKQRIFNIAHREKFGDPYFNDLPLNSLYFDDIHFRDEVYNALSEDFSSVHVRQWMASFIMNGPSSLIMTAMRLFACLPLR